MEERKLKLVENPPIVQISGLSKAFENVQALKNVKLEIPEGRIIGLLGPNGSGNDHLAQDPGGADIPPMTERF